MALTVSRASAFARLALAIVLVAALLAPASSRRMLSQPPSIEDYLSDIRSQIATRFGADFQTIAADLSSAGQRVGQQSEQYVRDFLQSFNN